MEPFTVDQAYQQIKDSQLTPLQEGGPIVGYWLRQKPDSLMMATLIVGTPVGVALMGDLTPGRGVIIRGYSLEWFGDKHEPRYIARKCLEDTVYNPDSARQEAQEHYAELAGRAISERDKKLITKARKMKKIMGKLEKLGWPQWETCKRLHSIIGTDSASSIGIDFDEADLAWLGAIQRRFHETYQALKAARHEV